tara:strand:- start:1437 stop:2306 length:870 start_codon:yes stop_codon:yes gene_type:complete
MDVVVGIGKAGCAVADSFAKYPQYQVYKIDTDLETSATEYAMPAQNTSEEYEANCPDMSEFFSDLEEDTNVTFVLAGGGKIAGCSLRVMEQVRHCKLNVLYLTPDIGLMGGKKYLLNRISFHVLQEYARSGLLNSMALIYNPSVEDVIGDVPVRDYYGHINDALVSSVHMINVFSNTSSVFENVSETEEHHRIFSYGIINPDTGEENLLFPLDNIREKVYYIGVNSEALEDGAYFKKLKNNMREKAKEDDVKISFQINETKYDQTYAYVVAYVDEPQTENNLKKCLTKS